MKSYKSLLLLSLVPAFALASCYHEFSSSSGGGGGGGTGTQFVNVLLTSTPSSTFSFASLNWPIGGVSITNSEGVAVSLGGTNGVVDPDFVRMQTDSVYMSHATLATTSYTSLQVQFNAPLFGYIYNNTNATLFSGANACSPGTVCQIPNTVPGFSSNSVTVPITYTPSAASIGGIRINFDLSKAVTTAGADGITFDFTQTGAITVIALPTTSSQSSAIDTMDNFTGVVTAVTSSTVTVSSFESEARTFNIASTDEFDDPFTICPQPATISCLAVGQNVSIDGIVNTTSSTFPLTANEIEFLDPVPAVNELEGVIISPPSNNQFKIALGNGMGTSNFIVSSTVIVNLNGAETYFVDPKELGILDTANPGFQSQADLVLGQTVMIQGGTVSDVNTSITNPTRLLLRYSSIGGAVQNPSGTTFTLGSPSFAGPFDLSLVVQTYPKTAYDNITGFSGLSGVNNASVRALLLNPNSNALYPLLAAKVRTH
ncbi:MAG: hypothetical protein ABSH39_07795 [Candidatus Acidiferrum sp.]|jgi:hypothetical protein